jgi:hypothetical protein
MTSPSCWTCTRHDLLQVALHLRLSCHVRFEISLHLCTVSVISPSYDIRMRCIRNRCKGDDDAIDLVLVLAPERLWIIPSDHEKVLRHLFGPTRPCIESDLQPKLWTPPLAHPNPSIPRLGYKLSSHCRLDSSFA